MDPVLSSLFSVADGLHTEDDLRSMKFLVAGTSGINIQQLDRASTKDFILMLKDGCDASFIGELLREIGRLDLCAKLNAASVDSGTSSRHLPEAKLLMFHMARSMTAADRQNLAFRLQVSSEDHDAVGLMRLIETREAVVGREDLRRVAGEFGLSHLLDKALVSRRPASPVREAAGQVVANANLATSVGRTASFCDETGCDGTCPYRALWSDKFPRKTTPLFNNDALLNNEDLSVDGDRAAEELLGEGAFGTIYKGQSVVYRIRHFQVL